jgi:type IV pilus assembly protein PilA
MKSDFKVKFLQHMIGRKNAEKGFTLIELLVVIIIIGILAAIALPSFLNQAAKAKQSEAKSYVGAVNRAQQAYRIENTAFAKDFKTLEVGLNDTTGNFKYTGMGTNDAEKGVVTAEPIDTKSLKAYSGGVFLQTDGQTRAITCEAKDVGTAAAAPKSATECADTAKWKTL